MRSSRRCKASAYWSVWTWEWQYKDILTEIDDQVWKDFPVEEQKYLPEKEESAAMVTPVSPEKRPFNHRRSSVGNFN